MVGRRSAHGADRHPAHRCGGRDEARAAALTLAGWNLQHAYTSPLARARETAEIVSPDCGLTVDDALLEWDYGVFEGETTPQTRERVPGWSVWTHEITGGETVDEVGERADAFLARVEAEVPDGNAVAFAHGHLLAVLIRGGAASPRSRAAASRSPPPP